MTVRLGSFTPHAIVSIWISQLVSSEEQITTNLYWFLTKADFLIPTLGLSSLKDEKRKMGPWYSLANSEHQSYWYNGLNILILWMYICKNWRKWRLRLRMKTSHLLISGLYHCHISSAIEMHIHIMHQCQSISSCNHFSVIDILQYIQHLIVIGDKGIWFYLLTSTRGPQIPVHWPLKLPYVISSS